MINLTHGKPSTSGKRRTVSPRQSVSSNSSEVGAKAYMPGHFTQLMRENNWPPSYRPSFYMERVGRGYRFVEMPWRVA